MGRLLGSASVEAGRLIKGSAALPNLYNHFLAPNARMAAVTALSRLFGVDFQKSGSLSLRFAKPNEMR